MIVQACVYQDSLLLNDIHRSSCIYVYRLEALRHRRRAGRLRRRRLNDVCCDDGLSVGGGS